MNYVLDASVAVAACRPNEPHHRAARSRIAALLTGADDIVVPALFVVEVASALARAGWPKADIDRFVDRDLAARTIVTIGPRRARLIASLAVATRLRAADAAYVWVAARHALPLVSADAEILQRAGLSGVTALPP